MPEPAPLSHDELAAGLTALMKHLGRSGVTHLPRGNPQQAPAWLSELGANEPAAAPEAAPKTTTTPAASPRESAAPALHETATPAASPPRPAPRPAPPPAAPPAVEAVGSGYATALPLADRQQRLEQLAETVAGCVRCESLACARTQTVFGEGNPGARVCFFGEGPGFEEDRTGRPFVGKAGQLLTKMIEACTFSREDVYILNTVKCRPPGNRNPEPEEIDHCREYFEAQFDVIQPEYIVCLGLIAAQSLLHSKLSVGRLRGRFHAYRNSKVLVTYHPAYLLRNPSAKRMAWQDLQMMLADMGIQV